MADKEKEEEREILIEYADPKRPSEIITIPASWKITYGPWSPRGKGPRNFQEVQAHQRHGWTLRIYETKERQRAVFTNVEQFRDLSIPLKRAKIKLMPSTAKNDPSEAQEFNPVSLGDLGQWAPVLQARGLMSKRASAAPTESDD